jgi:MEMO1 family protein
MPSIKSDTVRPAAVAGRFYPDDPGLLRADIERLIDAAGPVSEPLAAAYIAPHAGYRYSGPVAAEVYARLAAHRGRVRRVVLVGPSHHYPLRGHAAAPYARWETPLGEVRVAPTHVVGSSRLPHEAEHSLEVQLPFLQVALGPDIEITPVAFGMGQSPDGARLVAALREEAGEDSVVICSTDLSHYHDQATAERIDAVTAEAIRSLRPRDRPAARLRRVRPARDPRLGRRHGPPPAPARPRDVRGHRGRARPGRRLPGVRDRAPDRGRVAGPPRGRCDTAR